MTVETVTPLGVDINYRRTVSPAHLSSSFVGDDTDNHDFKFASQGKPVLNVHVDNAPNKALTWTLYGMHSATGTVGDAGTFSIATDSVAIASKADEGFIGYTYPYYLLRLAYSVSPTDDPLKTVSVYLSLMGGGL